MNYLKSLMNLKNMEMPSDLKAEVEAKYPSWVNLVKEARGQEKILSLDVFFFESISKSIYELLWYAHDEKVAIYFKPSPHRSSLPVN